MDLTPVLNQELLLLGDWLTEEVLCTKISAYQVMLPRALKAQYEKYIRLSKEGKEKDLCEELKPFLKGGNDLSWKEVLKHELLSAVKKEAAKGTVEVIYSVKEHTKKKRLMHVFPAVSKEQTANGKRRTRKSKKAAGGIGFFY